jgi:hypothetical protein
MSLLCAVAAAALAAAPAAEPPLGAISLGSDPDRVERALTLFDDHALGTQRLIAALTLAAGGVSLVMGSVAKFGWNEQLGGSYVLIGGGLSIALGLLYLLVSPPLHAIRLRFEAEKPQSPELAAAHALEGWRALAEQGPAARLRAAWILTLLGSAMVLGALAAVATPWFDQAGSLYARHTLAEALIPVGAGFAAAGLFTPFQPPSQVEIGFTLASGVGIGGKF